MEADKLFGFEWLCFQNWHSSRTFWWKLSQLDAIGFRILQTMKQADSLVTRIHMASRGVGSNHHCHGPRMAKERQAAYRRRPDQASIRFSRQGRRSPTRASTATRRSSRRATGIYGDYRGLHPPGRGCSRCGALRHIAAPRARRTNEAHHISHHLTMLGRKFYEVLQRLACGVHRGGAGATHTDANSHQPANIFLGVNERTTLVWRQMFWVAATGCYGSNHAKSVTWRN